MTEVLITVDTELSAGRQKAGMALADNIASSFFGLAGGQKFGIDWLMDQMERRGICGVFFVDPMPGLVHGPAVVEQMVEPILRRGHEVQVHIHTEWLEWAKDSPVEGALGRNIGDFSLEHQVALIGWAHDALVSAGAPVPTAFRAGNFGANDDTLRALAALGLAWDSSFNAHYGTGDCRITLPGGLIDPVTYLGVSELPVAGIWDRPGHFRPVQVCALSAREMRDGLAHAADSAAHSFCIVTHSFEMLSRDRQRPNRMVMARFEAMCDAIAAHSALDPVTFAQLSVPDIRAPQTTDRLPPSRTRTALRIAEQALGTWRYERQLRPA